MKFFLKRNNFILLYIKIAQFKQFCHFLVPILSRNYKTQFSSLIQTELGGFQKYITGKGLISSLMIPKYEAVLYKQMLLNIWACLWSISKMRISLLSYEQLDWLSLTKSRNIYNRMISQGLVYIKICVEREKLSYHSHNWQF